MAFAESAKNRDSVLSLGTIAHLQYYFARTGLLDGKGGQLAKDTRKPSGSSMFTNLESVNNVHRPSIESSANEFVHSPMDDDSSEEWDSPSMLPPTVSTYNHRIQYLPPPPDAAMLRKDLHDGLLQVVQVINEVRIHKQTGLAQDKEDMPSHTEVSIGEDGNEVQLMVSSPSPGWYELEGIHVLDVVTLAIRSAKIYYTMHENPQRLGTIKSERRVREELLGVLDVLKRMAARNFATGIKEEELKVIENWVHEVEGVLSKERLIEEQEARDRAGWQWLEGGWADGDSKREWLFMKSFAGEDDLPVWTSPTDEAESLPTPFLAALRTGLTLVNLHNRILKKSKRQFGEITTFHTDTAKPYRVADNLRYWIKAAEIRWETKIQVDVMGVVYSKGDQVWKDFDYAILAWSRAVREEITAEWKQHSVQALPEGLSL